MKKILIIGEKFHGKTTFAGFLKKALGEAESFSTSSYLVFRLSLLKGVEVSEILRRKDEFRRELAELGDRLCGVDAGCLVAISLLACRSPVGIIDGIRRISEFEAVKDWFDDILWIRRPLLSDQNDNLELSESNAHEVIENIGSLDELRTKAERYAEKIRNHT
ncbi:MAG: hypothetical protein HQL31_11440 [Planctomycetes bacterium]|nr:hypothetical protein [Planctomycetota bacterium]